MTKVRLEIRHARCDDAPVLADLWHEMAVFHAEQDPYWRIRRNCRKGYIPYMNEVAKSKDKAVFVACVGGKSVGFVLVQRASRARVFVEKEHGLIVDLAVTKDYRRQGIGERLLRRAVRWFQARRIMTVEVRASNANPVSTAFWRKMGFEPCMTISKKEI